MSDSEDSIVTYMVISSPFGGLSDIESPGVDGPPMMPEDPYAYVVAAFLALPSLDYVSGPKYPPLPEFVPEPGYPEFMPPEDDADDEEEDKDDAEEEEHPAPADYPEVVRLLAIPTLPSSPLSPWSSPLPQIPSPPLPVSPPPPASPTYP
ncbi:hypothetical protein Tco_0781565, partial [Tanacetum coccineum]